MSGEKRGSALADLARHQQRAERARASEYGCGSAIAAVVILNAPLPLLVAIVWWWLR